MPLEPPRFAISLWGSKDNTQISAGVVGLEGLVEEIEGYSFPSGPFLDTIELDPEVCSESESCRVSAYQAAIVHEE